MGEVSRHELYSKAAKHPQLRPKQPSELLLDHEFCRLFKALEGMIVKAVTPKPHGDLVNGSSELSMSPSENSLLLQYKDLIREQDHKLQELTQTIGRLTVDKSTLQAQVEDLTSTISQLRDENMLLRAQANTGLGQVTNSSSVGHTTFHMLEEARAEAHRWKTESEQKELLIHKLEEQVKSGAVSDLETRLQLASVDQTVATSNTELQKELQETRQQLAAAEQKLAELESAGSELEKLRKDQEDLLELLTDQDMRLNQFKAQLRALGEKVDDDDDLEEEGGAFEDEDSE